MMPSKFLYESDPNGKIDKGLINEAWPDDGFPETVASYWSRMGIRSTFYVIAAILPIFIGLFSKTFLPGMKYWLVPSL